MRAYVNGAKKFFYSAFFFFLFLFIGCHKEDLVSPVVMDYTKDFDTLWTKYDLYYPLFEYKKIDWKYYYSEYRDKFRNITVDERNELFNRLLAIFQDAHIYLLTPSGKYIGTYFPYEFTTNYNPDFIKKFTDSINWHNVNSNWGWGSFKNIGYMRITSLKPDKIDTVEIAGVLDSLKSTNGLIIDIREINGGQTDICEGIWNNFAAEEKIVGYEIYRSGKNHNDYAPEIIMSTRPKNKYVKKVVVLIGQDCKSAGELLAEGMSQFDNVTLVGNTTFGAVVAPSEFSLSDGTKYSVPMVAFLDNKHIPLERRGVVPDIYLIPEQIKNNTEEDYIIEKAVEIILLANK